MATEGDHLCFEFRSPGAETSANALADFCRNEFADWPSRRVVQAGPAPHGAPVRGEALDVVTLLISIPAAVLSAWDLAVRLQLKQKIERLITWAKERRARGERNPFVVLPPHGQPVPLDQVKPEQLLDAIAVQAQKAPPKP